MRGVRRCLPGPCRVHLGTEAKIGVSPRTGAGVPSPPGSPIPTVFPQILALNDPSHGGRMSRALRVPTWGWGAGTPPPIQIRAPFVFLLHLSGGSGRSAASASWPDGQEFGSWTQPRHGSRDGELAPPVSPAAPPSPGTHGGQEKPLSPPVPGHPSH